MNVIAEGIALQFPDEQSDRGVAIVPLQDQLTTNSRASLLILFGAVGCVLLIATANVANLLLARTAGRMREVALRLALGASRSRLIRQFLTESVVLAAIGGVAGILSGFWATKLLVTLLADRIPEAIEVRLDLNVVFFTAVVSLLVGIGSGLAPARHVVGGSADDLQTQLHGHGTVAGANRARSVFVIAEMAIAVVLLCGAGLLLRSFAQLQRTESGLTKPEQVLTARIALPAGRYATAESVAAFYGRALDRLRILPGVRNAGAINYVPFAQWGITGDVQVADGAPFARGKAPLVEFRAITGDYFSAVGVPLRAGRLLDDRDDSFTGPPTVVINHTLALLIAKTESNSLGRKLKLGDRVSTVVGVVGDVRQRGLARPPEPEMYFSVTHAPGSEGPGGNASQTMTFVLRAVAGSPASLAQSVRDALREVDPALPLFKVQTMQSLITETMTDRRMNSVLLASFAAVALALAAIGLYGVLSYGVTQRTRELGIRLALGAQRKDILGLIVGGGMKMVGIGLVIGLVAALMFTRLLKSVLYGIAPTDPVTFSVVTMLLSAVAFVANYVPAHRAMRVDPTLALKHD